MDISLIKKLARPYMGTPSWRGTFGGTKKIACHLPIAPDRKLIPQFLFVCFVFFNF